MYVNNTQEQAIYIQADNTHAINVIADKDRPINVRADITRPLYVNNTQAQALFIQTDTSHPIYIAIPDGAVEQDICDIENYFIILFINTHSCIFLTIYDNLLHNLIKIKNVKARLLIINLKIKYLPSAKCFIYNCQCKWLKDKAS